VLCTTLLFGKKLLCCNTENKIIPVLTTLYPRTPNSYSANQEISCNLKLSWQLNSTKYTLASSCIRWRSSN